MKNTGIYIISLILLFVVAYSCNNEEAKKEKTEPVVKVFDSYLYFSDLAEIVPEGTSPADSTSIVEAYINNWIQNQIMLHYAKDVLDKHKDEINKKTQDFKNSLVIYKFKEELIKANNDSNISNKKIKEYYDTHYAEFKLQNPIVKGYLLKINNNFAKINELKNQLKNPQQADLDKIMLYCNKNNGYFEDFTHNWVSITEKISTIPLKSEDLKKDLILDKKVEYEDDKYYYFMFINNLIDTGEIAPLEYVSGNIRKILLKRQNSVIIDKFKQQKYDEAVKKGKIEFY